MESQCYLTAISDALEDYTTKVTDLHIYPYVGNEIHTGQPKIITDICHLIGSLHRTLVYASFPSYLITYDVLVALMSCPNLRSIVQNRHNQRCIVEVFKGSEKDMVSSYQRNRDEDEDVPDASCTNLTTMDLLLPHVIAAHHVFAHAPLANLESLRLTFLGSQSAWYPKFDLVTLLRIISHDSPRLRHLDLFILSIPCALINQVAPVKWTGLQAISRLHLLESFQIIHPHPVEVTCCQLGKLLFKLPRLTKFILNPHPTVHKESSFGVEVLYDVANSRPEIKELGLFFNKSTDILPDIGDATPFHSLTTLFVGTSMLSKDRTSFNMVCRWLESILPATIDIEHYPFDFISVLNKHSFTVGHHGTLVNDRLRTYIDANHLWQQVETMMDLIKGLREHYLTTLRSPSL